MMQKILHNKYWIALAMIASGFIIADVSFAAESCKASDIRWAASSNRIYISGDVECTLSAIKELGSTAIPLTIIDENEKIWFLGANLVLENGAKLIIHSALLGGDVNELRLKSNNDSFINNYVEIRADYGTIDVDGVKITSWDQNANGPDTEYGVYKRAFIRSRSSMDSDGITPKESTMNIKNSDIGYLGFYGAESYGLAWKVLGDIALFDRVGVYGNIENNEIHHNYFGVYTYGGESMRFVGNEVFENIQYGIDPHDDSDYLFIDNNNVHHNGNHGIICSQRCNNITVTNNVSSYNKGNGIMLHRNTNYSLVRNNQVNYNGDSGIAIFDSHKNEIYNNISMNNKNGLRISVGSSQNNVGNNIFSRNSKYGVYFYKGSDLPTSGDGRPKSNIIENNQIQDNDSIAIRLDQSDGNTFKDNQIQNNNGIAVRLNQSDRNIFEKNTVADNDSYAFYITYSYDNVFLQNTLSNNSFNYYFAKNNAVNIIKNSKTFAVKMGDDISSMSIIDEQNAIFANSKNIPTKAFPTYSTIFIDRSNIGSETTAFTALTFNATPSISDVNISPLVWSTSGSRYKKWLTSNTSSSSVNVFYSIGNLSANTTYKVDVNGVFFGSFLSDYNGKINFSNSINNGTTKLFEVKLPS